MAVLLVVGKSPQGIYYSKVRTAAAADIPFPTRGEGNTSLPHPRSPHQGRKLGPLALILSFTCTPGMKKAINKPDKMRAGGCLHARTVFRFSVYTQRVHYHLLGRYRDLDDPAAGDGSDR